MNEYQPVTLVTLNDGAAVEMADREIAAVMRNIADPNTKPDAARKIVVTIVVTPDEKRELLAFRIESKSVLAATQPSSGMGYLVRRDGKPVAVATTARQSDLFDQDEERPDISPVVSERTRA